jgi:hypothetical protein
VGLGADEGTPVADAADAVIALPFADERSVVQTRFATSALTLLAPAVALKPREIAQAWTER